MIMVDRCGDISIPLSIHIFITPSLHISIHHFIPPSLHPSIHPSMYPSLHLVPTTGFSQPPSRVSRALICKGVAKIDLRGNATGIMILSVIMVVMMMMSMIMMMMIVVMMMIIVVMMMMTMMIHPTIILLITTERTQEVRIARVRFLGSSSSSFVTAKHYHNK